SQEEPVTPSPTTVIQSTPGPAVDPTPAGPKISWGPPLPRQCGRCRSMFPGDHSLSSSDTSKSGACPPCRIALFDNEAAWSGTSPAGEGDEGWRRALPY